MGDNYCECHTGKPEEEKIGAVGAVGAYRSRNYTTRYIKINLLTRLLMIYPLHQMFKGRSVGEHINVTTKIYFQVPCSALSWTIIVLCLWSLPIICIRPNGLPMNLL